MVIELRQRDVLRGRLRFPLGCALELFGVLPGADLPAGFAAVASARCSASGNLAMASSSTPEIERRAG